MDTLVALTTFTKGIQYLIAIGFLIGFVAYWQLVYGKGRTRTATIAILLYMVVGMAILVSSCLTTTPG